MLTPPWDLILTVLFAATGLWCAMNLVAHRARSRTADSTVASHALIDINHLVMSAAMILMIRVTVIDAFTWAQIAVFAVFALALLPGAFNGDGAARRISLVGHIILNAAMIWMLIAMPLLMAGMTMSDADASEYRRGADATTMPTGTPVWADAVNVLFVVVSAAAVVWWAVALLRPRARHLHDLCYAGMASGTTAMLVVMNA